jgi:hypothetical protein
MTIAKIGSLPQLWHWIVAWAGGLTLAGTGALVKFWFSIKESKRRIAKLEEEMAAMHRGDALRNAVLTLRRRAQLLLQQTNLPSLSRTEWASCLKDPNLVDEALAEIGAEREIGKADRWIIR